MQHISFIIIAFLLYPNNLKSGATLKQIRDEEYINIKLNA